MILVPKLDDGSTGYIGIRDNEGIFVPDDLALEYALDKCNIQIFDRDKKINEEFVNWFEDWFFSGNWIRRN